MRNYIGIDEVQMEYSRHIIKNVNFIDTLYDEGKLTHTDIHVIDKLINNLSNFSCKIAISQRELGRQLKITNINRHTKKFIELGLIKKIENDFYLNPIVGCKGTIISNTEYKMFKDYPHFSDYIKLKDKNISTKNCIHNPIRVQEEDSNIRYDLAF